MGLVDIDLVTARNSIVPALLDGSICRIRGVTDNARLLSSLAAVIGPIVQPVAMSSDVGLDEVSILDTDGATNYGANWHHDQSFALVPPDWSALAVDEATQAGATTAFADCSLLLDYVSEAFEGVLSHLQVVHEAAYRDDTGAIFSAARAVHPLIITLENGDPALFASPASGRDIFGWKPVESEAVFGLLFPMLNWPEVCTVITWERGDVVIWPNRRYVHRSLSTTVGSRRLRRVVGHYRSRS
jgi:alpha-ketoglutarate-dependent taurine dioxygenase